MGHGDFQQWLHRFWVPLTAYLALLGFYLIILGVALAGLATVLRRRDDGPAG